MAFCDDLKKRIMIIGNASASLEHRVFATLELFCMPMSFLTLITLIAFIPLNRMGLNHLPGWFNNALFPVLVSAAVGYMTNWIAIEMLFKPYNRTMRHPFAWLTFGYWRQGLVPKNRAQIAEKLGQQAEELIKPEKLASDICAMVTDSLQNPEIISTIQMTLQSLVGNHDKEIAAFLAPRLETALVTEIDRLVTAENIESFWREQIEPRLESPETREEIASLIIGALDNRTSKITAILRPKILEAIRHCIKEKTPFGMGNIVAQWTDTIADAIIDKKMIEDGLRTWLKDPATVPLIRDELLHFVTATRKYLSSDEAKGKVNGFVGEIRTKFKDYIRTYLETNLATMATSVLHSESLWQWAASLIPHSIPHIEALIKEKGMPLILAKINLQGRLQTAVDAMDMKEFHDMVGKVSAKHLGAIQVLGYILGALAGGLLLFQ